MTDRTPGDELIDAINMLNHACERMGVGHITVIGLRSSIAVNAVERELVASGRKAEIRQVIGGIEVVGVALKNRPGS